MDKRFDIEQLFQQLLALVRDPVNVWSQIAEGDFTIEEIFWPWVILVAVIQGFFLFLGFLFVPLLPFSYALFAGWLGTIVKVVGLVFLCGWAANLAAAKFEGRPDITQAMRLIAYAYTPVAAASLLMIFVRFHQAFFWISWIPGVLAFGFLVYLGCPATLGIDENDMPKRVMFTTFALAPYLLTAIPLSLVPF